jgi:hypothetical protein
MDEESVVTSSTPTIPAPTTTVTNATGAAVATVFGQVDISPVGTLSIPDKTVEEAPVTEMLVTAPSVPASTHVAPAPGSAAASITPTANPAAATIQSRTLLWRRELAILEEMGFDDFEAILPLLHEHLGCPVALLEDKHAAPKAEGMERVITALLTTRYI